MKKFNLLLLMSLIFGALVFNSCEEDTEPEPEEEIPGAPTVTAPSSITIAPGESIDVYFTVTVPGGYASAEISAQGGSATISDEPADGATSGTFVVSFTAGSTPGAGSITLTVTDKNEKSGNAKANLSIEEEEEEEEEEPEEGGTATDIDGNVYRTVVIGDQEWFAENLKTTKYNDGTPIPTAVDNDAWKVATSGAYAVYPSDSIEGLNSEAEVLDAYGALYNGYVEMYKLCPEGWHVATDQEWTKLTDFIGGATGNGDKLKSTRTEPDPHPRWKSDRGGTDDYGFSALPGGYRDEGGNCKMVGNVGYWGTSTELDTDPSKRWRRAMGGEENVSRSNHSKKNGYAIRCIRDE